MSRSASSKMPRRSIVYQPPSGKREGWLLQFAERPLQPKLAAQRPLDLAAGGPGQSAWAQQHDLMGHDLVLADDRLANLSDDFVGHDAVARGALDLLHDDELFRLVTLADGEG